MQRRAARRSPSVASSTIKAGPVVQHPYYATGKQRNPRPIESIRRVDADICPHQIQLGRLGSHARQTLPGMDDVLTAVPRSGVQPLASSGRIQWDARAKDQTEQEKIRELMILSGKLDDFEQQAEAAAAERAIEAEAEAIENEDDDALRVRLQCNLRIVEQHFL